MASHRNPEYNPKPGLTFLELAMLPLERLEQLRVLIHPVAGSTIPCFAITIDGDWLRGGTGFPAFFNSASAAARLMDLLNIPEYRTGDPLPFQTTQRTRCYRLHGSTLASCKACHEDANVITTTVPIPADIGDSVAVGS